MTARLRVDLAAEAGDRRVLGVDARLGGVDGDPIVAVVDQREKVALADDLVVDDRDLGQVARSPWRR